MNHEQPTFPLFNRIAVLVMSTALVIGIVVGVAQKILNHEWPDFVTGFLLLVFFVMACAGVWISLFWRNRDAKELAEEQSFPMPEQPAISDDALVYRFPNGLKSAAVYIDQSGRVIHFYNCHAPRRFLSSSSDWFTCPVEDVKAVHVFRYHGESLTIVTATGKALVPKLGTEYAEFRNTLKDLVPGTQPGYSNDHPMMGMVYLAGALTGLFGGFLLAPQNANDSSLGLYVLAGAFLGVGAISVLVYVADRRLKIGLAQPIGIAVAGLGGAMFLVVFLGPLFGWATLPMIGLCTVGTTLGFAFGAHKEMRERASTATRSDERTLE